MGGILGVRCGDVCATGGMSGMAADGGNFGTVLGGILGAREGAVCTIGGMARLAAASAKSSRIGLGCGPREDVTSARGVIAAAKGDLGTILGGVLVFRSGDVCTIGSMSGIAAASP